jgi:hypothetical protein
MFISRADVLLRQLGASEANCSWTRGTGGGLGHPVAEPWSTGVWPELKKIAIATVAEPAAAAG